MASDKVFVTVTFRLKPTLTARLAFDKARWELASLQTDDVLPQRVRGIKSARDQICIQFKHRIDDPGFTNYHVRWNQLEFRDISFRDKSDDDGDPVQSFEFLQGVGQLQMTGPIQLALL